MDPGELRYWDTIKRSEIPADFQAYLNSYPHGQFALMAHARLDQLAARISDKSVSDSASSEMPPIRDCWQCPELILIPSGSFAMGTAGSSAFERPGHHVSILKPFYLGHREVTFEEWDACVAEGGCPYRPDDRGQGRGLRPVTDVDWEDAQAYARRLSRKTGHAYRLPTESAWEYAARAGTTTAYPWGQGVDIDRANCLGCNPRPLNDTVDTGGFPPNGFGLFDMAGNAAEWVEDCWNDSYRGAPTDGSAFVKPQCQQRVLRGGSFNNDSSYLRSAARFRYDHDVRYYANGFRVVREN
jgi:formylglycine-generating enzyme required for sulfatase activity